MATVAIPAQAYSAEQPDQAPNWMQLYVQEVYVPNLRILTTQLPTDSCLEYVKAKRGITQVLISPKAIWNEGKAIHTPEVGLGVITDEGSYWHTAYIEAISSTSLEVSEANYIPGKITHRTIPLDSPHIMGYW